MMDRDPCGKGCPPVSAFSPMTILLEQNKKGRPSFRKRFTSRIFVFVSPVLLLLTIDKARDTEKTYHHVQVPFKSNFQE